MIQEPEVRGDSARLRTFIDALQGAETLDQFVAAFPVASEGDVLAVSGSVPTAQVSSARPLLDETRYYDSGDLWTQGDSLVEVGASSVVFGDLRLGVLLGGRRIAQGSLPVAHDEHAPHPRVVCPAVKLSQVVGVSRAILEELVDVLHGVEAVSPSGRGGEVEVVQLAGLERSVERPLGEGDAEKRLG